MAQNEIRFDDGEAYERYMGKWSQLAGEQFLKWLAPKSGLRWLDVGCGNGAFTEMLAERHAPSEIHGIDPSVQQLAYARGRPALQAAQFRQADAMALPFAENTFDVVVMPLVIFFVPDPARGVAEMARVVAGGGIVAAYAWDMPGGGFPYDALWSAMREMGATVPQAPSPEASRIDVMRELWAGAGLQSIETRQIVVERSFPSFEDYWAIALGGPSVSRGAAAMNTENLAKLKEQMRASLPADAAGRITYSARANAVKGRVSG